MDNETFKKIAGLLGLSAAEIAEGTGYTVASVRAFACVTCNARNVPEKVEEWILDRLREARDDEAVKLVRQVCGEAGEESGEANG